MTKCIIARAAWTGGRWIDNPQIDIADGTVVSIAARPAPKGVAIPPDADLGDVFLLPGFVNAHLHLEYSFLHGQLRDCRQFPQWLSQVVQLRREAGEGELRSGIANALRMLHNSGTTTLLDISTSDIEVQDPDAQFRMWAFLETIQMDPERANEAVKQLEDRLDGLITPNITFGLSPHTPYTVSPELAHKVALLAAKRSLPLAIHLAETPEERLMVEQGRGPLVEMFESRGLLPPNWKPPGVSPVEWAWQTGLLGERTFAIHCNYISEREIERLASTGTTVVYCPGSHRFFSHEPHPLPELLRHGVNVCLGTDSLASNESLDMLREMRIVRELYPQTEPEMIFDMSGKNAAAALGVRVGDIEAGGEARFAVVPAMDLPPADRLGAILDGAMSARGWGFACLQILTS